MKKLCCYWCCHLNACKALCKHEKYALSLKCDYWLATSSLLWLLLALHFKIETRMVHFIEILWYSTRSIASVELRLQATYEIVMKTMHAAQYIPSGVRGIGVVGLVRCKHTTCPARRGMNWCVKVDRRMRAAKEWTWGKLKPLLPKTLVLYFTKQMFLTWELCALNALSLYIMQS